MTTENAHTATRETMRADTITFTGNSDFAINCDAYGTKAFGPTGVRLVS
jgi:hypothetical protein